MFPGLWLFRKPQPMDIPKPTMSRPYISTESPSNLQPTSSPAGFEPLTSVTAQQKCCLQLLILTNRKITNIVYTFKQMNSELWSPGFAEAVTFLLASKICETIPNLKNEANNKFQQYQGLIAVAKNDDVREEMKFYDKNPFKNYRGYDGSIF